MERLHNSLIGFAKIHAPSFKNFPEIWSIPAVFVTSTFFDNLNKQPSTVESNLKLSKLFVYQFGTFGSFANKFPAKFEQKLLKVSKVDLVSCFTI